MMTALYFLDISIFPVTFLLSLERFPNIKLMFNISLLHLDRSGAIYCMRYRLFPPYVLLHHIDMSDFGIVIL